MAEALRLGTFLVAPAAAALAFFNLASPWGWLAPLAIVIVGGLLAERVFKRFASPTDIRRDLEGRRRNPPP